MEFTPKLKQRLIGFAIGLSFVGAAALAQTPTIFNYLQVNTQSDLRGAIVNGAGDVTVNDGFVVDSGGGADELTVTAGLVTLGARTVTPASTTAEAGFNLPQGTAPTAPVNGDLWTTTSGLFARINGGTIGPFSVASGTVSSVGVTNTGGDLVVTGSPVTTSGNINIDLGANVPLLDADNTWTGMTNTFNDIVVDSCTGCGGGGGTPGGSDMELQYNNGGAFGGIPELAYDDGSGQFNFGSTAADWVLRGVPGATDNLGAAIDLVSGAGDGTGSGGGVFFAAGAGGATGEGGAAFLQAGAGGSTSGNGGAVLIEGGDADGGGDGGGITLNPGVGAGGGTNGSVNINGPTTIADNLDVSGYVSIGDYGLVSNNNPIFWMQEADAGATSQYWAQSINSSVLSNYACTAFGSGCTSYLDVTRSAGTITVANLQATAIRGNGIDITPREGNFTVNFTDACSTTPSMTFFYSAVGDQVTIQSIPGQRFTCTSDSTGFNDGSAVLPAAIRPGSSIQVPIFAMDNGVLVTATLNIGSSGTVGVGFCNANVTCGSAWTNSGSKGLPDLSVTYLK